jgi:hypothetical protein
VCTRCERPFFDRRNCPLCGAPVGAFSTGPGLLRDLADGFVRVRDAAYLRVGVIGDEEWAALTPEERQRRFAAFDGQLETRTRSEERRDVLVAAPVRVVTDWLHAPERFQERVAALDGDPFEWIERDGGVVGYTHAFVSDDESVRQIMEFEEVDGYGRVTSASGGISQDDEWLVVGESVYSYRPAGYIEQANIRINGGLHAIQTSGMQVRPDPRGSRLLMTVKVDLSWPVDIDESEVADMEQELIDGVLEELTDLHRVVTTPPLREPEQQPHPDRGGQFAASLAVLGLDPDCTPAQVRTAYRELAQLLHPDRHHGAPDHLRAAATGQMSRLNDAYRTVCAALGVTP